MSLLRISRARNINLIFSKKATFEDGGGVGRQIGLVSEEVYLNWLPAAAAEEAGNAGL